MRLGNVMLDEVRRRVQQETLEHRGHKDEPLYGIRRLLLTGEERLTERGRARIAAGLAAGDPADEVWYAWTIKSTEAINGLMKTIKRVGHAAATSTTPVCAPAALRQRQLATATRREATRACSPDRCVEPSNWCRPSAGSPSLAAAVGEVG